MNNVKEERQTLFLFYIILFDLAKRNANVRFTYRFK